MLSETSEWCELWSELSSLKKLLDWNREEKKKIYSKDVQSVFPQRYRPMLLPFVCLLLNSNMHSFELIWFAVFSEVVVCSIGKFSESAKILSTTKLNGKVFLFYWIHEKRQKDFTLPPKMVKEWFHISVVMQDTFQSLWFHLLIWALFHSINIKSVKQNFFSAGWKKSDRNQIFELNRIKCITLAHFPEQITLHILSTKGSKNFHESFHLKFPNRMCNVL